MSLDDAFNDLVFKAELERARRLETWMIEHYFAKHIGTMKDGELTLIDVKTLFTIEHHVDKPLAVRVACVCGESYQEHWGISG